MALELASVRRALPDTNASGLGLTSSDEGPNARAASPKPGSTVTARQVPQVGELSTAEVGFDVGPWNGTLYAGTSTYEIASTTFRRRRL